SRSYRKRLCRPGLFAGDRRGGYWPFFDRQKRLPGQSVQYVDKAHFGADHNGGQAGEPDEYRLSCNIEIPDIVMHDLETPYPFAGGSPQSHQRIGIQVGPQPFTAVIIRARTGGRHEDHIARGVRTQDGPGVGRTTFVGMGSHPGRISAVGRIFGDRVPAPAELAGMDIVCPDDPGRLVEPLIVAHRRTGDHKVADNDRRRGLLHFFPVAVPKIDHPVQAEIPDWLSVAAADRDEPAIDRPDKQPQTVAVAPGGYTAIADLRITGVEVNLRIIDPVLFARFSVDGEDAIAGRTEIQRPADQDGR